MTIGEDSSRSRDGDFFQTLIDALPVLVSYVTREERYALVNKAYESWFNRPRETIVGKPAIDVIGPDAYAQMSPFIKRALAGETLSFEQHDVAYRGGMRDVLVSFKPVARADHSIDGFVALLEDITARRRLELERETLLQKAQEVSAVAREERAKLLEVFMQSPVAIAIVEGAQHVYTFANPHYFELLGRTDLVGRALLDVFPEVRSQGFGEQLDRVKATGAPLHFRSQPVQLNRKGTVEQGFYNFVFAPKRDPDGVVDGVLLCGFEVTEQTEATKRAEELASQLARSEEQLRRVVESSGTGTWEVDLVTRQMTVDRRFRELFGFPLDVPISVAMALDAPPPEDRAGVASAFQRALDGHDGGRYVVEHRTIGLGDAPIRWVEARGQVIRDGAGQPVRIAGTAVDIGMRKSIEAERAESARRVAEAHEKARRADLEMRKVAEQSNRSKDEFLAMLGHELRNPLAPITTALELMRLSADDSFLRERVIIERQVKHLSHLVDDLLDVSRIASGKIEVRMQRLRLADVVADAIEMVSPLLESRMHAVTVDVSGDGLDVDGDPQRLKQVIGNLLTNAAKYTELRGRIDVRARREGNEVVLRVRDNGVGISAEMLTRVFDLFAQERQAIDRAQGGLGLGLAIVRSLVRLHGGSIEAHSEGLGRGSELVLRLPLAPVLALTTADMPAAEPVRRVAPPARRLLLVDDNIDAVELLAHSLSALGHDVRVAHDGAAALELVKEFRPDAAILDIGLPVMDGHELGRRLRHMPTLDRMKLFALTGYGQATDHERSATAGFDAHLVKPVKLAVLRRLIES